MAKRGVSRKKLVIVGCTCSFFIYLLLVRRLVPRLSSPLVGLPSDESNRHALLDTRQALSESALREQHPHALGENRQSRIQEQYHIKNNQLQQVQQRQHLQPFQLKQELEQHQKEPKKIQQQQHQMEHHQEGHQLLPYQQQHRMEQQQGNSRQQQHQTEKQHDQHLLPTQQLQQQLINKKQHHYQLRQQQQHQKEQRRDNHLLLQQQQQRVEQQHDGQQFKQQLHTREDHISRQGTQSSENVLQRVTSNAGVLAKHQSLHSHNANIVEQINSRPKESDITWIDKVMQQKTNKIKHPDNAKQMGTSTNALTPALTDRMPNNASRLVIASDGHVRNCLTGDVIGHQPKPVSTGPLILGDDESLEDTKTRVQSFQKVFDTRAWGHSWDPAYRGVNASGRGATLQWTQEFTATLHRIVSEVRSVRGLSRVRLLDVPCGDMAWMSRFLRTRDDIDYTGVDIVPSLIAHHRKEYSRFGWKFFARDVVQNGINGTYDIIVNRMMLQHLYFNDVKRLLAIFSNSGSDYLLTTTFAAHAPNEELRVGDDGKNPGRFRKLNLEIEPVSLEAPLCLQRDGPPDDFEGWNHYVALWRLPLKRIRWCTTPKTFPLKGTGRKLYSCAPWA